jgi:hypothetical protein
MMTLPTNPLAYVVLSWIGQKNREKIHWAQCPGLWRKVALLLGCWALVIAIEWWWLQ